MPGLDRPRRSHRRHRRTPTVLLHAPVADTLVPVRMRPVARLVPRDAWGIGVASPACRRHNTAKILARPSDDVAFYLVGWPREQQRHRYMFGVVVAIPSSLFPSCRRTKGHGVGRESYLLVVMMLPWEPNKA